MNTMPSQPVEIAHVDAENALLGALMAGDIGNDAYARVQSLLKPEHFYLSPNRVVYEAIQSLHEERKAVTPITVKGRLPDNIQAGELKAPAYVLALHGAACSLMEVKDYADQIRDAAVKRQLQAVAALTADLAQSPSQSAPAVLNTVGEALADVRASIVDEDVPMDLSAAVDAAKRRMNGKTGAHEASIPLPFPTITNLLGEGMEPGGLYGILGASQEGKTSLVLPIMRHAAENGHPAVMMSFDQTPIKCLDQLCSQSLGIDAKRIRRNDLKGDEFTALYAEQARLGDLPLNVMPCTSGKMSDVANLASAYLAKARRKTLKPPLVVIDHIGSLEAPDTRADAGRQGFSKADYFLKFAKAHGCVVIMLLQRNSVNYAMIDKRPPRPTKRDIEGGEATRRPFDAIIGLFRPEFWRNEALKTVSEHDQNTRDKIEGVYGNCDGVIEISLIKARYSDDRITRKMQFEGAFTRVSEFPKKDEQLPF